MKPTKNISNMVFRRNIPFKLETYVVNCEMLQVLAALDGIKNVSDIAAGLNKQVSELMTTFATLYQQKLILSVKPNHSVVNSPPSQINISYNLNKINDSDLKTSSLLRQRPKLNEQPFSFNLVEKRALRSKRYAKEFNPASNIHSSGAPGEPDSHFQNNHTAEKKIFEFKTDSANQKQKRNRNIFSINHPKQIDSSRKLSTPFSSGRSNAFSKGKDTPIHSDGDITIGFSNEEALEYFERGLSFSKQRSYKEALHQFEKALELDPQNRLCRANIKRIRKILEKGNN
jgi:hypothetical protein